MTQGEDFMKIGKCKYIHCSAMSNVAWCDSNNIFILRLHDYCPNPKCKCPKQNTFTPKQLQMEGSGFENTITNFQRKSERLEFFS